MQQARTYLAHIGSLSVPNYWMATAGLTDGFFTEAVGAGVSKATAVAYRCDAARLYLRSLAEDTLLMQAPVRLPDAEILSLYKALIAAHKSPLPTAQLVTRIHKIHTLPNPNLDRVALIFDRHSTHFSALASGNVSVKFGGLNDVLQKYQLVIAKYFYYDEQYDGITLLAQKPLNIAALCLELKKLPDVAFVENIADENSESDIRAVRTPQGWLFEYCLHTSDQPIAWLLEVKHNGEVICHDDGYVPHARSAKGYTYSQARPIH